MPHNDLFIVDNNGNERSVRKYLKQWCPISKQMDIATGYLEIGGLLDLDGEWQKMEKIRIILGDEMTKRTKSVIDSVVDSMINRLRDSVDEEQEKNEFLLGVPAIIHAMQSGKIECRVFDRSKFHAKTYIAYFSDEYKNHFVEAMHMPDGFALVGSSNFTHAGLNQNIELNIQVQTNIDELQAWFEEHWKQSKDITEALLKAIENRCREFSPYDVYMRSMYELFKTRESTVSEWEQHESKIYSMLSQYQRDGYNSLVQIADKYSGAFLCDGVGLGKTFVGMMLIERFVKKERKNVVLIVPASARVSVWEVTIKRLIPEILEGFYPFKIINHTDLLLDKNQNLMNQIAQQAEAAPTEEAGRNHQDGFRCPEQALHQLRYRNAHKRYGARKGCHAGGQHTGKHDQRRPEAADIHPHALGVALSHLIGSHGFGEKECADQRRPDGQRRDTQLRPPDA